MSSGTLQRFMDVFSGRFDTYALAKPHRNNPLKRSYINVKEPLTPHLVQKHLDGDHQIGIYPLVDNHVRWVAIDFDSPKDAAEPFLTAYEDALKQAERFEELGLNVYLERSRSGTGVHLWMFLEEPVEAALVLRALKPMLVKAETFDRMYPVQSQVEAGGYGNLIALPYNGAAAAEGNGVMLNRETLLPIELDAFLESIEFNYRSVIEELATKAPKLTKLMHGEDVVSDSPAFEGNDEISGRSDGFSGRPRHPVPGFLKVISQFGCPFMHAIAKPENQKKGNIPQEAWWMAVGQLTNLKRGRDAAHLISMLDPRYSAQEVDETFNRIARETPHGCLKIHEMHGAQKTGLCKGCVHNKAPWRLAEKPILDLTRETVSPLSKPKWKDAVDRIRKRNRGEMSTGLTWGIAGLDKYTRLRRAEFIVVGARPSVGKTAFMVDAVLSLARRGIPVFVFSAESGETTITDRIIARITGIDSKRLRGEGTSPLTEEELEEIERAAMLLGTLPIFINYAATRADQILALLEETILAERIPLDQEYAVFQDYLQFGNATDAKGGDTPYARISKVSSEFKAISMILNQAFTTFTQLKREAEGDDKPDLSAARESGQIEQDANVFIVLAGERVPGPYARRVLHILKDKEAEAGHSIEVLLHQAICKFEALPGQGDDDPMDPNANDQTALDAIR